MCSRLRILFSVYTAWLSEFYAGLKVLFCLVTLCSSKQHVHVLGWFPFYLLACLKQLAVELFHSPVSKKEEARAWFWDSTEVNFDFYLQCSWCLYRRCLWCRSGDLPVIECVRKSAVFAMMQMCAWIYTCFYEYQLDDHFLCTCCREYQLHDRFLDMAMRCSEFVPYSSKQGHKQIKHLLIHATENFTSLLIAFLPTESSSNNIRISPQSRRQARSEK